MQCPNNYFLQSIKYRHTINWISVMLFSQQPTKNGAVSFLCCLSCKVSCTNYLIRIISSSRNNAFSDPITPCCTRKSPVASHAAAITTRYKIIRRKSKMRRPVGMDTNSIRHGFYCSKRLKYIHSF